jgi:hypothetical protein
VVRYLDWLLDLGFDFGIILSIKVKVLGGGFGLWLGDNIAILSMVKRAHLLFLTLLWCALGLNLGGASILPLCCYHGGLC